MREFFGEYRIGENGFVKRGNEDGRMKFDKGFWGSILCFAFFLFFAFAVFAVSAFCFFSRFGFRFFGVHAIKSVTLLFYAMLCLARFSVIMWQ